MAIGPTTTIEDQISLGSIILYSDNSSIPICVNCQFFEASDRRNCNYNIPQYIDLVTGDTLYQNRSAEDMRINSSACGPNAAWFSPNP